MRIALCQLAATADPATNLELIRDAAKQAADAGARIAVFPEAAMAHFGTDLAAVAEPDDGPWASAVRAIADDLAITVIAGMFTPADQGRVRNVLLATGGGAAATYQKIHVYDAFGHRESDTVDPGETLVHIELDGIRFGLATCYDVRFPELFRALARDGADAVILCAAWGAGPGKLAQWELLTRARALDSTSWILACDQADPATIGVDVDGPAPRGIGHSAVIAPDGTVADSLEAAPGVLIADIDPGRVETVRRSIPVLANARL
ncbi:putative amidohydrolase [Murinocardiopsis flavida]|uniref:Putative amidohydrolase n=1 Tax=Murinocardiopsis flavida TaxID=645275 RepID=A0A2P8CW75_9ACTN|nr:carbon-nitrogen hydrolase family protein [Murinocardiopsis flavida]PSK89196.1 putative amidohydrolase [Murinocardiopsis flavida]